MKKAIIVALVCLNAGLLVTLIAGTGTEPAYGQVIGSNYVIVTGNIYSDYDGIYVLDLASRRLAAWRYEKNRKPYGLRAVASGRNLRRDFGRQAAR